MATDRDLFKLKMRELMVLNEDTAAGLAEYLGMTYQTLSKKINLHKDFTRRELKLIKKKYKLSDKEFCEIFFKI